MPPSRKLALGPPLNMRAANKTAHPSDIDKSHQHHLHAEMQGVCQEKAQKEKENADAQQKGLQAITDAEDYLCLEDENHKCTHIQAARSKPGSEISTYRAYMHVITYNSISEMNGVWQERAQDTSKKAGKENSMI